MQNKYCMWKQALYVLCSRLKISDRALPDVIFVDQNEPSTTTYMIGIIVVYCFIVC